jgi:hypothetical protein
VLAVLAGGCMKIYPDTELPDVEVQWEDFDCVDGTGDVRIELLAFETSEVVAETTVACTALAVTFEDVARERYRVEGSLLDTDGSVYSRNRSPVDLRDGISERVPLYFGAFSNFRIGWTFETGTCATSGARVIVIDFAYMESPTFETFFEEGCLFSPYFGFLPEGSHRVRLRARANLETLAVSPTLDVVIVANEVTDVGTVVLAECGADCPD